MADFGLKQTKFTLWNEANLSCDYKICDNIDLDTIYLDFCSYHHLKFGKLPKMVKKIENDQNDVTFQRSKVNKMKSAEKSIKLLDEHQKKVKQECSESESNAFTVTNSVKCARNGREDEHQSDSTSRIAYIRKNKDLFQQFSGETLDLAHVIERFV